MADATARSLQYEYKAVSLMKDFCSVLNHVVVELDKNYHRQLVAAF